jgi:hypothetical protein
MTTRELIDGFESLLSATKRETKRVGHATKAFARQMRGVPIPDDNDRETKDIEQPNSERQYSFTYELDEDDASPLDPEDSDSEPDGESGRCRIIK